MNFLYYNNYLNNCDLCYRFKEKSLYKFKKFLSLSIRISLSKFVKNFESSYQINKKEVILSNVFLFLYTTFSLIPYINFQKKGDEIYFKLKLENEKIFFFLFEFFNFFYHDLLIFLLKKDKVLSKNYNNFFTKIHFSFLTQIDFYIRDILKSFTTKGFFFELNIKIK